MHRYGRFPQAVAIAAALMLAGAHLSFPGLGHLRPRGKGYLWIPVNYTLIAQP